jgi:hypothetical protein
MFLVFANKGSNLISGVFWRSVDLKISSDYSSFRILYNTSRYPYDFSSIRSAMYFHHRFIALAISRGMFYDHIKSLWKCKIKINWCSDTPSVECASIVFSLIPPPFDSVVPLSNFHVASTKTFENTRIYPG